MPESYVEALLAERDGYVARGLRARVAEVDAELARFGVKAGAPEVPADPSIETPETPGPRLKRRGR